MLKKTGRRVRVKSKIGVRKRGQITGLVHRKFEECLKQR